MYSRPPVDRNAFGLVPWYGLLIFIGIVVALFLSKREERRLGLPKDTSLDFALLAIPLGIIGSRLYYVAFQWGLYADDWTRIFNLREGGLAIPGAVLGGMLAAWITARRRRVPFLSVCDMVVAGLVLAQAIGRWGNYINMEAYGFRINDPIWQAWQVFPLAVEIPVGGPENYTWYWHLATFFYESAWNVLVFGALMAMRRHLKRPGDVFCWYLVLYGVGRTVIEGLRTDSLSAINQDLRVTQILCALSCAAAAIVFFARRRNAPRSAIAVAHDALLLLSLALGLAATFLGEFERSAYGMRLFPVAQWAVLALLAVNVMIGILRAATRRPVPLVNASFWLLAACFAGLLLLGRGYETHYEEGNIIFIGLYPSLRQLPAMLQIAACAGAFCFETFKPERGRRLRPAQAQ
ncbi:MAG: prolipoprotein diacylglyceryl transferase [Clostridia bacterium]|nr:prolipoprotein diacylglyceryl transferase [Clostridia bacterium]